MYGEDSEEGGPPPRGRPDERLDRFRGRKKPRDEHYAALTAAHVTVIKKYCRVVAPHFGLEFDDLYQEVSWDLWKGADVDIHNPGVLSYLWNRASRVATRMAQRESRRPECRSLDQGDVLAITEKRLADNLNPTESTLRALGVRALMDALGISEQAAQVLAIKTAFDFTFAEIAQLLDRTESAVKKQYQRTIDKVRRMLVADSGGVSCSRVASDSLKNSEDADNLAISSDMQHELMQLKKRIDDLLEGSS